MKLYIIITDYLNNNLIPFNGKNGDVSRKNVRKYIKRYAVIINEEVVRDEKYEVGVGDIIKIGDFNIEFDVTDNMLNEENTIDSLVPELTQLELEDDEGLDEPPSSESRDNEFEVVYDTWGKDKLPLSILYLLSNGSILEKKSSKLSQIIIEIEDYLSQNAIVDKLKISKKDSKYFSTILKYLEQEVHERRGHLLEIGYKFNKDLYSNYDKFIQDYSRLEKTFGFKVVIKPLMPFEITAKQSYVKLIKLIRNSKSLSDKFELQQFYYSNKHAFEDFNKVFEKVKINDLIKEEFDSLQLISNRLKDAFQLQCVPEETGFSNVIISAKSRKYIKSRTLERQDFFISIINNGSGLAKEINIDLVNSGFYTLKSISPKINSLKPGERIELMLSLNIDVSFDFTDVINLEFKAKEVNNSVINKVFEIQFDFEEDSIPWEELNSQNPYAFRKIEERSKLYGRDEILKELIGNVNRQILDSFKIWGQKRVGKSSIVKTFANEIGNNPYSLVAYIEADRAHIPEETLVDLCDDIADEIKFSFSKIPDKDLKEKLDQIKYVSSSVSFNGLRRFFKSIIRLSEKIKIVVIIDEFDRLNEEFFLPGNIGETFSQGLGKNLKSPDRVSIVLVGAENMKLLDRQELNYNEFKDRKIDFFDKETQYKEFSDLVKKPLEPHIKYSVEAVEEIYEMSGGNPYFVNLICHNLFRDCQQNQENHIQKGHVDNVIKRIISSENKMHFTQYWDDGLIEENLISRDVKSDIRKRLLVAYNLAYNEKGDYPDKKEVIKKFNKPSEYKIENFQIDNTFNEFLKRSIFIRNGKKSPIMIRPLLFEKWLCFKGNEYLLSTGLADLEAKLKYDEEQNSMKLNDDEIHRLANRVRTNNIEIVDIRNYLNQFGEHRAQRVVFNMLDSLVYISKDQIIEFFQQQKKNVFEGNVRVLNERSRKITRSYEIFGFKSFIQENSEIFDLFKTIYSVSKSRKHKPLTNFNGSTDSEIENVIILEPCLININEKEKEQLESFAASYIKKTEMPKLVIFTLAITSRDRRLVSNIFGDIDNFELYCLNEYSSEAEINPFIENSLLLDSKEEKDILHNCCMKIYNDSDKKSLSVVFETHSPIKSHKILWKNSDTFKSIFPNSSKPIESKKADSENAAKRNSRIIELDNNVDNIEIWLRELYLNNLQESHPGKMLKLKHLTIKEIAIKIEGEIDQYLSNNPAKSKDQLLSLKLALNFTTFYDLSILLAQNEQYYNDHFKNILGSYDNFKKRFSQVYDFRNTKRHNKRTKINNQDELSYDENIIDECEVSVRWFNEIINSHSLGS